MVLFCGTMIWLVLAFFIEHMRYIYLGVTTNESAKWEDVQDCIGDGTIFMFTNPDIQTHSEHEHNIVVQKMPDGSYNRRLSPEELRIVNDQKLRLTKVKSVYDITNIYDKGFRRNFIDRAFPASL